MGAVVFPSILPQPSALSVRPRERALRSNIPEGLPQARAIQREFIGNETLAWTLSAADYAVWMDFWKNTLLKGQRWFLASWPQINKQSVTARFTSSFRIRYLGNDYVEISIGTEIRRSLPPFTPRAEADLYLKFDEADSSEWRDYSIHGRQIILHPNAGTITGQITGGRIGRGGDFAQAHGGSRVESYYNSHSWIEARGNINFGADDFIIDFTCLRRATTDGQGWCIFDNLYAGTQWPYGGWYVWFIPNSGDLSNQQLVFSAPESGSPKELQINHTEADIGTRTRYTFSRQGQRLTGFRNGVAESTNPGRFSLGGVIDPIQRGFLSICASHQNEANDNAPGNPAQRQLIDGFDGVVDQMVIKHGPGIGISSDFDPLTTEFA